MTAMPEQGFIVLLVGVRINQWWRLTHWWRVLKHFRSLRKELSAKQGGPLLGHESFWGNPLLSVQYWRSWEELEEWARRRGGDHREVWTEYTQRFRHAGAVGVWHETYIIEPGYYETVYNNMPPFGLGRIARLEPAKGKAGRAAGRLTLAQDRRAQRDRPDEQDV